MTVKIIKLGLYVSILLELKQCCMKTKNHSVAYVGKMKLVTVEIANSVFASEMVAGREMRFREIKEKQRRETSFN